MSSNRLPSKIIPPHYENIFPRTSLHAKLESKSTAPLLWVSGPPGAGKTMLAVGLLQNRRTDYLWYRVDPGENSSEDIFYFLNLAAKKNKSHKRIKLPVFSSEYADNCDVFAKIFFRQFFSILKDKTVIVFDNCQEFTKDASFDNILQIALSELPEGMQILCLSRNRPISDFNRMRLCQDLVEVTSDELCFSEAESRDFLQWLKPNIDEQAIRILYKQTSGWAAGMVLMTEHVVSNGIHEFDVAEHDNYDFLFDYLASEIFFRLNDETRNFLLKISIFSQLHSKMAKQLTGNRQAKQLMDALVSKNCLIERSAGADPLYTLNPVFRSFLLKKAKTTFTAKEWHNLQTEATTLLIQENRGEDAFPILHQQKNWPLLKDSLLNHAESFIQKGRYRTLIKWINSLPENYLKQECWLNYWYAVALSPIDPISSASRLDQCYVSFAKEQDILGLYASWQAAVDAVCNSMDDFSSLKIWFARFEDLRINHPACPKLELKIKFYATAIRALSFYDPQHPWLKSLLRLCERFVRIVPISQVRNIVYTQLGHYYLLTCQLSKLQIIVPYLQHAVADETLPTLVRILNIYLMGVLNQYYGKGNEALILFKQGIELSEFTGILLLTGLMRAHIISCHITLGEFDQAEDALNSAFSTINPKQRMFTALFHSYAAWLAALRGKETLAFEQNQLTLQLTQQICVTVGYICSLAFKTQFLAEKQQWQKAEQAFSLLQLKLSGTGNHFYLIQFHLTDAWLGFLKGDDNRTLKALRHFLTLSRSENVVAFFGWRPDVMTPLCVFAIEHEIEEDFVIHLLKSNPLFSSPPLYLKSWPWPIKIYCFGSFQIELDGRPLEFSGKSQKKIFDLLLTMIALGGHEIDLKQLSLILWPESDGDYAHKALETSIHRLRKMIGKEAIVVKAGKVSINDSICWLDLWTFEQLVTELNKNLERNANVGHIIALSNKLSKLYRGSFVHHEEILCTKVTRDQIQNRLFNLMDRLAEYHELRQEFSRAQLLLETKLQLDPTVESNYARLIDHYIKQREIHSALKIYQQCERTLPENLGIQLSEKIKMLMQEIS